MSKSILLTAFLCVSVTTVFSQTEIPVNLYTGTPFIEVPLWTLTDYDISVPVSLSYAANGVKLQQDPGSFGLGWDLIAEGNIERELRGLPDDYASRGWLYTDGLGRSISAGVSSFGNQADISASTCSDEADDANSFATMLANGWTDPEPDIYTFNFGGFTGTFLFDAGSTPTIRFAPHKDFAISYTTVSESDKSITSFIIVTSSGFKYTFGQAVSAYRSVSQVNAAIPVAMLQNEYNLYKGGKVNYNAEWKLTRIDSPSGAYVTFCYSLLADEEPIKEPVSLAVSRVDIDSYDIVTQYTRTSWQQRYWLDDISGSAGKKIAFEKPSGESLDRVTITDPRNWISGDFAVRQFSLSYQTIWSRKFLKAISEANGCERLPSYIFDYIGISNSTGSLPTISSTSKDFWGYYNGRKSDRTLPVGDLGTPKLYVYPDEPSAERYRIYPIPNYSGTQVVLNGCDRSPDEAFMKLGTLNKVTYPTGGSLVIQYEANKYFDQRAGVEQIGGGLRIKSISQYDGINGPSRITKVFDYTDPSTGKSSGKLVSRPQFAIPTWQWISPRGKAGYENFVSNTQLLWKALTVRTSWDLSDEEQTQGSAVGYQFVTVSRPGIGSALSEFSVPGTYGLSTTSDYWSPTISKFARSQSCPIMGIIDQGGAWMYPYSRNPQIDFERGLVLSQTEFDETGKKVRFTKNDYQYIYQSGGGPGFIPGLTYDQYANADDPIFLYGKYLLPVSYDRVLQKETVTVFDVTNGSGQMAESTEYLYNSPSHRYLAQVKKTRADGSIYTSTYVYPGDYSPVPAGADASLAWLAGLQSSRPSIPIETIQSVKRGNGSDQVIGATFATYSDFGTAGKIRLKQALALATATPLTNFVRSATMTGSGTALRIDSRYDTVQTVVSYDQYDNPLETVGIDGMRSARVLGYNSTVQIAGVTQAANGSYAFSGFDADMSASSGWNYVVVSKEPGRADSWCTPVSTALRASIVKANAANYKLSFWVKNSQPVSLNLRLRDPLQSATVYYQQQIAVDGGHTDFTYVEKLIPVGSVPSAFVIEFGSGSGDGVVDDVAFYPENARITYYNYQFPHGAVSATGSNGMASYTKYDNLGRVLYTYDRDKNIISRASYKFSRPVFALSSEFSVPTIVYRDNQVTFVATGADNGCISGETYEWDMGSGTFSEGETTMNYTFWVTGKRTIRLKVSHPEYGESITSKEIDVIAKPIPVTVCVTGPIEYECIRPIAWSNGTCGTGVDPKSRNAPYFNATVGEDIPGLQYTWSKRNGTGGSWFVVSNGPDYSGGPTDREHDFYIKCDVTANGRTGTDTAIIYVNTCDTHGGH